jgi:hypothetical protein
VRYGLNHKTVARWRKRACVDNGPMGPKDSRPTIRSSEDEAIIAAFRKHTFRLLDDCPDVGRPDDAACMLVDRAARMGPSGAQAAFASVAYEARSDGLARSD